MVALATSTCTSGGDGRAEVVVVVPVPVVGGGRRGGGRRRERGRRHGDRRARRRRQEQDPDDHGNNDDGHAAPAGLLGWRVEGRRCRDHGPGRPPVLPLSLIDGGAGVGRALRNDHGGVPEGDDGRVAPPVGTPPSPQAFQPARSGACSRCVGESPSLWRIAVCFAPGRVHHDSSSSSRSRSLSVKGICAQACQRGASEARILQPMPTRRASAVAWEARPVWRSWKRRRFVIVRSWVRVPPPAQSVHRLTRSPACQLETRHRPGGADVERCQRAVLRDRDQQRAPPACQVRQDPCFQTRAPTPPTPHLLADVVERQRRLGVEADGEHTIIFESLQRRRDAGYQREVEVLNRTGSNLGDRRCHVRSAVAREARRR